MAVDAESCEGLDEKWCVFGAGASDFVNDGLPTADSEEAADGHRGDQGNDLIPCERGDQGGDRQEGQADEEASEIAREDGPSVGIAEVSDGPDHGEGQKKGESPDEGTGEELSDDGAAELDREGSEELNGAGIMLIGPLTHADGRHQDHEKERVIAEERAMQAGIADPPEVPDGESEEDGEEPKDDHDGVSSGLREVAA